MKLYPKRTRPKWSVMALGLLASIGMLLPSESPAADGVTELDPKSRKELEEMESLFGQAIEHHDSAALSDMLAEYYADSYRDRTTAVNKRGTIARASAGTLSFYRIEKDARFTVSAGMYTIEGEAKAKPRLISDQEPEVKWVQVRRLWTKKDGHWLLVAQIVGEPDEKKDGK